MKIQIYSHIDTDTIIMVAGGESGINHEMNGVEILHIHENGDILNEDCKSHHLPIPLAGHSGIYYNNSVVYCGGNHQHSIKKTCYQMKLGGDEWKEKSEMISEKENFDMSELEDVGFVATEIILNNISTQPVEIYNENGWRRISDVPVNVYGHCTAPLSHNKMLLIGGMQNNVVSEIASNKGHLILRNVN